MSTIDPFVPFSQDGLSAGARWLVDPAHDGVQGNEAFLPVYQDHSAESQQLVLRRDLEEAEALALGLDVSGRTNLGRLTLFDDQIVVSQLTAVSLGHSSCEGDPEFGSCLRHLAAEASQVGDSDATQEMWVVPYFSGSEVLTRQPTVRDFARKQVIRAETVRSVTASLFAQSASYMGSKKQLRAFLVESMSDCVPAEYTVLDLMCGSGAASGAFATQWPTYVSDALQFCTILGTIHGAGACVSDAQEWLQAILPAAASHSERLIEMVGDFIESEDQLFHEGGEDLAQRYSELLRSFPTIPNGLSGSRGWSPADEVRTRRSHHQELPYCLFTAYFANTYFGIRQCTEIDSLRYAIDQLPDRHAREWALGALIAAVSASGSTYAGHFAQPPQPAWAPRQNTALVRMLERRSTSVAHEFSVRLLNLARASESSPRPIHSVEGPWRTALSRASAIPQLGGRLCVYVDAPYKREEYSRYYHVLETLVAYDYPAALGKGLTPDRQRDCRPSSKFSTRSMEHLNAEFVALLSEIVCSGWIAAWSYSDSGDADMVSVSRAVVAKTGCSVRSYATRYVHHSQGNRPHKRVVEYLILFVPG